MALQKYNTQEILQTAAVDEQEFEGHSAELRTVFFEWTNQPI